MGQFSWLDCVTGEQIVDNKRRDVYLLVPKEFGGGHIKETCYDGYGHFGGYDVYDLVARWNRGCLSENPNHIFPYAVSRAQYVMNCVKNNPDYSEKIELQIRNKDWYEAYKDLSLSEEEVVARVKEIRNSDWVKWRFIGIDIACYDEDNEALPFPIKITYDKNATYETCGISISDPNQGWECNDEYDDEYDEEYDDGWC